MQDSIYTLVPPLVAILVALWRKNAIEALAVGLLLTGLMQMNFAPIEGVVASGSVLLSVFQGVSNQRIIIFSLLIGALLMLIKHSGGVNAFISSLNERNLVKNQRQASLLPSLIGTSIFTDSNLSMFTAGIASQNLFDKFGLSRARLAFLIDSTCSPVSILFLINGWGAYVLGLLDGYQLTDTVGILIETIAYNFYPIIVLIMVYYTAVTNKVYGPLKYASSKIVETSEQQVISNGKARYMLVPMVLIVLVTLLLLYITGEGDLRRGSGSFAVMWAVIFSFLILCVMLLLDKVFNIKQIVQHSVTGIKNLLPAVIVLVLSFAFGDAVKAFGTGTYVSGIMSVEVAQIGLAPLLFITAGIMAFATGTSWGTFAILIPIAVPLSIETGLPPAFLVAAVLGGGVFGDHSSPISDSTIVASIASGCEHLEHVKTQLPYTLVAGLITICLYIVTAVILF
ncbi:Na+/H+ antiporter NhaC family protein [Pseudoalteromonas tunicata]|uniref:Na+/H+ antiporter NhaC family protein n=1 Tax=Pseudoalteromonas tunicata TaxID=314281 RepID=UPI00273ECEB3|nr:Na+/H+ antiporter NhaC family protein [Pseudoalteromonas tunicata]MDP4982359.1 sodium:proton antiporter [Pseudoalteromonas tunicata]